MDLILNWLWQGGLVAVAAALVLRINPRWRAPIRYRFLWAACCVVLALPAMPSVLGIVAPAPAPALAVAVAVAEVSPSAGPAIALPIAWWTSIELAIAFWIVWATVYSARLTAAATAIRRARKQCRECPGEVQERLPYWIRVRASGRRTQLVLSTDIRTAAVLGCGSPVIAIAPALLTNLSDADLDRVVIHEWAHVQRRDDVTQLVQRLVRVVAGWHPAVWWLGRQLDLEREVACDEMAIAATGSARAYAECLTTLAALRLDPFRSLPALAVVASRGLRQRIVRILAAHPVVTTRAGCAVGVGASVALSALALVVGNVRVVQPATRSIVVVDTGQAAGAPRRELPPDQPPPRLRRSAGALRAKAEGGSPEAPTIQPTTVSRMVQSSGSSSATGRRGRPAGATMRIANRGDDSQQAGYLAASMVKPPASAGGASPLPLVAPPLGTPTSSALGTLMPVQIPFTTVDQDRSSSAADETPRAAEVTARTPWSATADAGVAIGRGSRSAGVATAGFFSRVGKKIAGSF